MSIEPGQLEGRIGVFDSGVGGIGVLRELLDVLPGESYAFFGDSANAPYGDKPPEQVFELSSRIARGFVEGGCKAIVIACNTATSTAAAQLREAYPQIPIIGIEPALKPAALAGSEGDILVMATDITLKLDKFQNLLREYGESANVVTVPCIGLADRIEKGDLDAPDLMELVESLVGEYRGKVASAVLGCTHYTFIRRQIREVLGDIPLYDGNRGTALQLKRVLEREGLAGGKPDGGDVALFSSIDTQEELDLYRMFLQMEVSE